MIISHMIPMGRLYIYLPFTMKDAGKDTSAMDPRGFGVFMRIYYLNLHTQALS